MKERTRQRPQSLVSSGIWRRVRANNSEEQAASICRAEGQGVWEKRGTWYTSWFGPSFPYITWAYNFSVLGSLFYLKDGRRSFLRNVHKYKTQRGPYIYLLFNDGSRDSAVGIATGYGLDDWEVGVRVPIGSRIFSKSSRPALGSTQPPIQWVPGVKRPCEADPSPSTSAEVKQMWIYTSTPPYALTA
jgi:hypothetical protein